MNMLRATTIKEALKRWETEKEEDPTKAKVIELQFQWPPIEKMDTTLSTLTECEHLSLSSNMIEKIVGINGLKYLRILSLARNNIKSLTGLESVGQTLEELWISYNLIEKLKGIEQLKVLKVIYISNNLIKDWSEFSKLNTIKTLVDLIFTGNPLVENMDEVSYRGEVQKRLPHLEKLDGIPIIRELD